MPFNSRERPDASSSRLIGQHRALWLALLAMCTGVIAAAVSIAFRATIEIAQAHALGREFEALPSGLRFVLPIAGTFAGICVIFALGRGRVRVGVVHVLEQLAANEARLPFRNAALQFIAGSILLAFGMSLGREGPAIHLGAASGSLFGRWSHVPADVLRTLLGCGVAAAIAGAFNTPLAGAVLALEVMLMQYTLARFVPILLAALTGALLSRLVYGPAPAFIVPPLALTSLIELPWIATTGIAIAALAAAFIVLVRTTLRLTRHWPWWLPMLVAAVLTGAGGIAVPQILGIGYDVVNRVLLNHYTLGTLAALAVLKVAATGIAVGGRMPGGLIGPTFVIGAAGGGVFGHFAQLLMPGSASDVGLYAMLGMGAMMAATLQAPFAALFAVVELTGNPHALLPGVLAIACATVAAKRLFRCDSVFRMQLRELAAKR